MSLDDQKSSPETETQGKGKQPVLGPANGHEKGAAPHRGRSLAIFLLLAIAVAEGAYILREPLAGLWKSGAPSGESARAGQRKVLYWQDPMHPQYKSDKPGTAPDCGMDLVPVYADSEGARPAAASRERKVLYWQDPMNPQHKSDKPGKASDGTDLVPVYVESGELAQALPESAFRVTPEKQQLIGVQYGEVVSRPLAKTIRAVGRLTYDETKITRVHSKIAGWIERVFVDFTGELVKKGQPLLSVYSPDLVATQDEYLLALRARDKLGKSSFRDVAAGADSLLEAARRRLELWDITDEQISELEKTKKPAKALTLYSTANGFVISRNAYERQRIMPETELYAIADLSTIWVIADVYEFEAPLIRVGQAANMTLTSFPGRILRGKVTYIYPQLDNTTRTLKVRAEFPNPDFLLKPDMYANVELRFDFGKRLSVPQEAVLDSGSEQLVFVALNEGYFEPRKVQLGDKVDNVYIVLNGLKAGERVVTSGNFLIDSESKLKSAASGMGMPGMDHGAKPGEQPKQQPAGPAPKKEESMDHSKRQMKPEQHRHD